MSIEERLEREVAGLGDLSRHELAARWKAIYRTEPPKGARRPLLERAIAWHIQARALGGLSPHARRALDRAIRQERRTFGQDTLLATRAEQNAGVGRSVPSPGARLVREWEGKTHFVDVTDRGYVWQGDVYRSLSVIARTITGARWSGPRFFGL